MSTINATVITADKEIQAVSADISKLDVAGSQVNLAVAELAKYKIITSKVNLDDGMALLKLSKEVEKAIESRRVELVKPFNDAVKQINNYAKGLTTKLGTGINEVKDACLKYQLEEEKKAKIKRAEDRKAAIEKTGLQFDPQLRVYKLDGIGSITINEIENYEDASFNAILNAFSSAINIRNQQQAEAAKEQSELDSFFGGDDTADIATADINPLVVAPVNGQKVEALKGVTKRWVFDITDVNLIPREYLVVDETAIRKAVAAGVRTIPGTNIYQQESLSIR